jgi:acetyltransferase-like isoleucine patch superfamily enzyme
MPIDPRAAKARTGVRIIGRIFMSGYRIYLRLSGKAFSLLMAGAFAGFGRRSVIMPPLRVSGESRIEIGAGVFIGANSWLQALPDGASRASAISIGDGASIAGACVISAVRRVVLEEHVLLARNVYISDHVHRFSAHHLPVLAQGVEKIAPVVIKRGAWLGQNVVVCPGVTIGIGAVVGANSVVRDDIPDHTVAAGAPARLIKATNAPPVGGVLPGGPRETSDGRVPTATAAPDR